MRQPPGPDDPTSVGRFRVVGLLGSGGMGRVLLGEDADGRQAAIKLVHSELVDDGAPGGFRARFRREVQLAAQAPPGWTAPFLDADPDAPRPWLATAFLDAPSLLEHLDDRGPYRPDEAATLGAGLAAALSALHSAGLVHRDLKPSNVLLTDGGPRLIDFGISRAVDGTALTATGQSVGTPEYMSPEQVIGAEAGPPSDVFSLGSLLVFAVRGRTPFAAGSPTGALYRVVHDEPDLSPELGPLLPVLRSCLSKDPAARPTAPQARDGLTAIAARQGRDPVAAPETLVAPVPGGGDAGPGPVGEAPTVRATVVDGSGRPDGPGGGTVFDDDGGGRGGDRPDVDRAGHDRPAPLLWGPPPGPGPGRTRWDDGLPQGWAPPQPGPWPPGGQHPGPSPGGSGPPATRVGPAPVPSGRAAPDRRRTVLLAAGAVLLAVLLGVGGTLTVLALRPDPDAAASGPPATTSANPFLPPTGAAGTTAAPPTADVVAGAALVDTSRDIRFGSPAERLTFRTPSGNIACSMAPFEVRCDVVERTWQVPPRPSTCQQAYGTGVQVAGATPAQLTCVGDTLADPALPALDYGRALRTDEVTCVSRQDGVECRNATTGHGFTASRGAYRLY